MAVVGEGKGFKMMIAMAVMTVLMTLPLFFLELHSPGLMLAPRADGGLAPVELSFDRREGTARLSTILSTAIPEGFPLAAHLRVTGEKGVVLVDDFDREVALGKRDGVIHVRVPMATTASGWKHARIELRLYRNRSLLLLVAGQLEEGRTDVTAIAQRKPKPEDG